MNSEESLERLQQQLLTLVFQGELTPQQAARSAIRAHPDVPLLTWVFVLTMVGSELREGFVPEQNWSPADWLEAAAELGCEVYALDAMGIPRPTGHDLAALWAPPSPKRHDP